MYDQYLLKKDDICHNWTNLSNLYLTIIFKPLKPASYVLKSL